MDGNIAIVDFKYIYFCQIQLDIYLMIALLKEVLWSNIIIVFGSLFQWIPVKVKETSNQTTFLPYQYWRMFCPKRPLSEKSIWIYPTVSSRTDLLNDGCSLLNETLPLAKSDHMWSVEMDLCFIIIPSVLADHLWLVYLRWMLIPGP